MGQVRRGLRLVACSAAIMLLLVTASGCISPTSSKPYSVSGRIADAEGRGIEGISLTFGGFGIATTDADGAWIKDNLKGTVKVTPATEGWRFEPASRSVSAASSTVDFVGTKLDYVGLHEGTEWAYLVTGYSVFDGEETVDFEDSITIAVQSVSEEDDGTYFAISPVESPCAKVSGASRVFPDQIVKPLQDSDEPWMEVRRCEGQYCLVKHLDGYPDEYILLLQKPIKQGHMVYPAIFGGRLGLTVEAEESVTTPAGSFKAWRCTYYEVEEGYGGIEFTLWFAPYVGTVKFEVNEYSWDTTNEQHYLDWSTTFVLQDYVAQ